MNRRGFIATTTALIASIAGCQGSDEPEGPVEEVTIQSIAFDPVTVSVDVGTTIRWTNDDDRPYTISSIRHHDAAEEWEFEEDIDVGGTVTRTFDEAGLYEYEEKDRTKQYMCGAIVVGDAHEPETMPCSLY